MEFMDLESNSKGFMRNDEFKSIRDKEINKEIEQIRLKLEGMGSPDPYWSENLTSDEAITVNSNFVHSVVKGFENLNMCTEELTSIGIIGLVKAQNTYNPSKGAKFATYAARCIKNEILMWLRKEKKHINVSHLEEPIGWDDKGNEKRLEDELGTERFEIEDALVRKELLSQALELFWDGKTLDDIEVKVIDLKFGLTTGKPLTQKEMEARLGKSQSYISRIQKRGLKKLMKAFEKRGLKPATSTEKYKRGGKTSK